MDKFKISLIVVLVLGLICIALLTNIIGISSDLKAEKSKVAGMNVQITRITKELSDAKVKYDGQVRVVGEIQKVLDSSMRELESAKREVETLKTANNELRAKITSIATAVAQ